MKNLNKRTKILLGIAGLVIVVIVVGLVLLGSGAADLFGTTVIHISPQNPTITIDQTITLSINSLFACKWSSSVAGVVTIVSSADRSVTLKGAAEGTTTIKADCAENRYTNVTVKRPTPTPTPTATVTSTPTPTPIATATPNPLFSIYNPTVRIGQSLQFTVTASNCAFTSSAPDIAWVTITQYGSPQYYLTGGGVSNVPVQAVITATCTGATGKLYVTVIY